MKRRNRVREKIAEFKMVEPPAFRTFIFLLVISCAVFASVNYPALSLANQSFCDNFGDGGVCDHGYSANWVQIATMEGSERWVDTASVYPDAGNDTTNYKEGLQGKLINDTNYIFNLTSSVDLSSFSNITFWADKFGTGGYHIYLGNDTSNYFIFFNANADENTGWIFTNLNKSSATTTGSPSWGNIRQITIVRKNASSNFTVDDLRAVKATGQFNDTANNRIRYVTGSGSGGNLQAVEIQNVSGTKMLRAFTALNGVVCVNQNFSENTTYYWDTRAVTSTATPIFYMNNLYVTQTQLPRDAAHVVGDLLKLWVNNTMVNSTAFDVTLGQTYQFKYTSNAGTATLCINGTTCVSYTGTNRNSGYFCMQTDTSAYESDLDNILIQSHIPPAVNTTDNSGTFTRAQALEVSALDTGNGSTETVADWYQNGVINQTAKRMIAYYPFDAPYSNSTFTQDMAITPSGNATVYGATTWIPNGIYGGAYSFETIIDTIYPAGSVANFTPQQNFTFSLWARAGTIASHGLLTRSSAGSVIDWGLYISGGTAKCYGNTTFAAASYVSNETAFFACTYNGTNVSIYKNGAYVASTTDTHGQKNVPTVAIYIGYFYGTIPFNGTIDEVRIYNSALSASEISQLYTDNMLGKTLNALGLTYSTGAVWYAKITNSSTNQNSQNATLVNSIPSAPTALNMTGTFKNSTFIANCSGASDADNDALTYFFKFTSNSSVLLQDYSTNSTYSTCSQNATCNKTSDIKVFCKVSDGAANSSELTNTTNILNSAPISPTLSIPSIINSTSYNFTWTASSDIDNDSLTYFLLGNGVLLYNGSNLYFTWANFTLGATNNLTLNVSDGTVNVSTSGNFTSFYFNASAISQPAATLNQPVNWATQITTWGNGTCSYNFTKLAPQAPTSILDASNNSISNSGNFTNVIFSCNSSASPYTTTFHTENITLASTPFSGGSFGSNSVQHIVSTKENQSLAYAFSITLPVGVQVINLFKCTQSAVAACSLDNLALWSSAVFTTISNASGTYISRSETQASNETVFVLSYSLSGGSGGSDGSGGTVLPYQPQNQSATNVSVQVTRQELPQPKFFEAFNSIDTFLKGKSFGFLPNALPLLIVLLMLMVAGFSLGSSSNSAILYLLGFVFMVLFFAALILYGPYLLRGA